jgi:hypothetical protein
MEMSAAEPPYPALVAERLTLLPLTSELRTAYGAAFEGSIVDSCMSKSFNDIIYSSIKQYRRSYVIFVTSQLPVSTSKLSSEEQRLCVGVVSLIGYLVPAGRMRDDDIGPRQYEWQLYVYIRKEVYVTCSVRVTKCRKLIECFSRQLGYAREACRAAMQSLAEAELEYIKASKDHDLTHEPVNGRDVRFTATMPENDTAAKSLTGQLAFQEVGYSTDGRHTSIIKAKSLSRCRLNAQGVYENVSPADLAVVSRPDPWDRYWEPRPVVADRVVLLPMTSADQTAYEAATSTLQRTVSSRSLETLPTPSDSKTDLRLIVFSDALQDQRSYGIFKLVDLVGLPSDMKTNEDQKRKCIGLVTLAGRLGPPPSSPENGGLRRFNWELDVTIIPSERKQGYGKESAKAAIKALLEEGAGEENDESHNKLKRSRFGVKGSQGLGEEVFITGRFAKNNAAAKALLKALRFHSPSGVIATEKVQVSKDSKDVSELMVRPVGSLEGHEKTKEWVWASESQPGDTKNLDIRHWWNSLW